MNIKSYFNEKLSKVLFLDIKSEFFEKYFNINLGKTLYMPLSSNRLVNSVEKKQDLKEIPISYFIEGMFYVMGLDPDFKQNKDYIELLQAIPNSLSFIKGEIYRNLQDDNFEEAYIKLRGLTLVEDTEENFDKLFKVIDYIRTTNSVFAEEELRVLDEAKKKSSYSTPHIYEALLRKDQNDFEGALVSYNLFISMGGRASDEIKEIFKKVKDIEDFRKGKEIVYDSPVEALKLLLPLIESSDAEAAMFYYIAVAYRIMNNHEKAIYYLNEAIAIDDALVEVVNELGVNYASLGDYDSAVQYFRKAFEATKVIDICTNIIMCYLNKGDLEQAKLHMEIARKLNPQDEILKDIEGIMGEVK